VISFLQVALPELCPVLSSLTMPRSLPISPLYLQIMKLLIMRLPLLPHRHSLFPQPPICYSLGGLNTSTGLLRALTYCSWWCIINLTDGSGITYQRVARSVLVVISAHRCQEVPVNYNARSMTVAFHCKF